MLEGLSADSDVGHGLYCFAAGWMFVVLATVFAKRACSLIPEAWHFAHHTFK